MAGAQDYGTSAALRRLIDLIDDLDQHVPDEHQGLLEELEKVHDELDNATKAMSRQVSESSASGLMPQYRQLERDLEYSKDELSTRERELAQAQHELVNSEARLNLNDDELKQLKRDKRDLESRLDRLRGKHEEEVRQLKAQNVAAGGAGGADKGGAGAGGALGGEGAALQEENYELQQQLLHSQVLLQKEDSELQNALRELQALAEANDDMTRRLEASQRTIGALEDDLVLAQSDAVGAARRGGEAEAVLEEKSVEVEALRLELSTVVPSLERQRLDLQAEVRRLGREAVELRDTALGGNLEATVATLDSLKQQLDLSRASELRLASERDAMQEDREVLEQVINDLSNEALVLSSSSSSSSALAAVDGGVGGALAALKIGSSSSPNGNNHQATSAAEWERTLNALRHDLEVSKAANHHLGTLASERAQELEAVQLELHELTRGDRGKEALVGEQKVLRAKLRELRHELEQSMLRHRDAEEAKLHLEAKVENLGSLVGRVQRASQVREAEAGAQAEELWEKATKKEEKKKRKVAASEASTAKEKQRLRLLRSKEKDEGVEGEEEADAAAAAAADDDSWGDSSGTSEDDDVDEEEEEEEEEEYSLRGDEEAESNVSMKSGRSGRSKGKNGRKGRSAAAAAAAAAAASTVAAAKAKVRAVAATQWKDDAHDRSEAMAAVAQEALAIVQQPLAPHHQTTTGRLRAEVGKS
jgi:hypothetical protein